jgi:sodium pump decarboxylase gamma subunit
VNTTFRRNYQLIGEGVIITILGMSVVFIFLGFLVLVMRVISAFARKIAPEAALPAAAGSANSSREAEIAIACAAAFLKAKSRTKTM